MALLIVPFFGAMALALMVITYVPKVSLWLPEMTGQLKAEEVKTSIDHWNESLFGKQDQSDSKEKKH
ncbi:MAG: hypothetical protein ACYTEU_07575 [Planctomycetota bacterium]|jgi:hypothetical protein